jgi:hypothetical protein
MSSQKAVDVEVQVTWEDQKNINAFGRLNGRMHEFEEDISKKQVPSLSSAPTLQVQAPHTPSCAGGASLLGGC